MRKESCSTLLPQGVRNSGTPEFGVILKEVLDALGVEAHVQYKGDGKKPTDFTDFVIGQLKGEAAE